jgi:TPR repeat protein
MRLTRRLLAAVACVAVQACAASASTLSPINVEHRHSRAGLDRSPAFEQLRQQAEGGDAEAAYRLGLMYRNGSGVAQDKGRAAYWVDLAAQRRMATAMFTLSNMLDEGEGVTMDKAAARRWLEAAAELEYPEALQQLALTETDPARAALLMKQAAHAMMHSAR